MQHGVFIQEDPKNIRKFVPHRDGASKNFFEHRPNHPQKREEVNKLTNN
ncbi:unnamed protein product [Meloidogyne enterolobii]|uniref:Uncharacterized protein n=1 Tax=Meloidogyne enterolobii TaxID=390850 RepID=A0ACB1BAC6_MELEN